MASLTLAGRADLLRLLAAGHGKLADAVPDEEFSRLAERLALHPQPGAAQATLVELPHGTDDSPIGTPDQAPRLPEPELEPRPARRPPLQARFFAVLQASPAPEPAPRSRSAPEPLSAADCAPRLPGEAPILPLVPRTRLWPALRRSLARPREAGIDVPGLVRRLARAENVRRLPRRSGRSSGGEVWVVVDRAQRLLPYDTDFEQLIGEVARLHGAASLRRWEVCESPDAVLWARHGLGAQHGVRGRIPVPPPGTPVLILGDLGLLSTGRGQASIWLEFCRRLRGGGADPVAWLPLSPRLVSRQAARYARVHCLGGDLHPLRPARCAEAPPPPAAALDSLLTRLACCVRVEPALLRSLRLMHPDTAAEPGLEALVWGHPSAVTAGYRFCEVARPSLAGYRARFAALDAAAQDEILRRMLAAHAHRGRSTETVEALIWRAHTGRDAPPGEPSERMAEAIAWLPRVAASAGAGRGDVAEYARDLMFRQWGDAALLREHSVAMASLWAVSGLDEIPPGLDSRDVAEALAHLAGRAGETYYRLVQRDGRLFLVPRELTDPQQTWPEITVTGGFEWSRSDGAMRSGVTPGRAEVELALGIAPEAVSFSLISGQRHYQVGLLARPSWAIEWGIESRGLYALAPAPLGEPVRLLWHDWDDGLWTGAWPPSGKAFRAIATPIGPGMTIGADLEFGLYLEIAIGQATQRFRWVEPGEFLMGSPEGEVGRDNDEGPQHVVRLTEGYWLAETACSQALWSAVMGSNPSKFQDDSQSPVEQVSWDDAVDFLRKVEGLLPGLKAELPTEAEWEYACRARAQSAFNWGNNTISPAQANYNASFSYGGGPTGEYRKKTVSVKSFTPNAWGLYQMHGNVWEWCADGPRTYDATPQQNPRGETGDAADAPRVVRGGSWIFGPSWLRAAFRLRRHRDWRDVNLGFRFLLRSTSPCAERPLEAVAAPEGSVMSIEPLTLGDKRSSYIDNVAKVIEGGQEGTGPVPWSQLRDTIPSAKNKQRKTKRGREK